MKHIILFCVLHITATSTTAQTALAGKQAYPIKPPVDTSDLGKWPYVTRPCISADGNYAVYTIERQPAGSRTLVVQDTKRSWKKNFAGIDEWDHYFIGANNQLVFKKGNSLHIMNLGTGRDSVIANVLSYKCPPSGEKRWLAWQSGGPEKEVLLYDLITGKQRRFDHAGDYSFDASGNALLVKKESGENAEATILQLVHLKEQQLSQIWSSAGIRGVNSRITSYRFGPKMAQLVFLITSEVDGRTVHSVWYYEQGMDRAVKKISDSSAGISSGLAVSDLRGPQISANGQWIIFALQPPPDTMQPDASLSAVNVWSYKDVTLQPEQMRKSGQFGGAVNVGDGPVRYAAAANIANGRITQLEHADEKLMAEIANDYAVVIDHYSVVDRWWTFASQPTYYVVSLKEGTRKALKKAAGFLALRYFSFSPRGRFLVYYDMQQKAFYSYDLATGILRNISKSIHYPVCSEYVNSIIPDAVAPVAGWHYADSSLLICDNYDIWEVDPMGQRAPLNVTNGFGRRNHTKLGPVNTPRKFENRVPQTYRPGDTILLSGFNVQNKNNGFYVAIAGMSTNPRELTMGPYTYFRLELQKPHFSSFDDGMPPLPATDGKGWIVKRQSTTEAPNYFYSTDLRTFVPLSELAPQNQRNWLTAELHTWKQTDGRLTQGILYKPENFDPKKKYPVIFNYYEKLSHRLYEFPYPSYSMGNINYPWFISNGYLLFVPDIHFEPALESGKTVGECAYAAVVSAARYLSAKPFVDTSRMGLQGHSFGGMETNYIISNTSQFAAACEASGVTDFISAYLTLSPLVSEIEHHNTQGQMEEGHLLFGAPLWSKPDVYLKSSAVLHADKINTPLLIMHNMKDGQIQGRQGVELFMALRRLQKKAWLLQYDNGEHGVYGIDAKDFTIRLGQFFDHYLKGLPAPVWMTKGIPYKLKQIDNGLQYDLKGTCGPACPVCDRVDVSRADR